MVFTILIDRLAVRLDGLAALVLHHLSINSHFSDFTRGLVDLNDVLFFVSTTGLFLFLAVKVLESRRWR
jgi:ABC-2 type transport system permease protein